MNLTSDGGEFEERRGSGVAVPHPGLCAAAGDEADGAEGDVDKEPAAETCPCLEVAMPVKRRDLAWAVRRGGQLGSPWVESGGCWAYLWRIPGVYFMKQAPRIVATTAVKR